MFKTCCGDCGECWYVGNPRTCTCPDETTQRPWVGLTDDEISEITSKVIGFNSCAGWEEDYARAIEQALKEKNT